MGNAARRVLCFFAMISPSASPPAPAIRAATNDRLWLLVLGLAALLGLIYNFAVLVGYGPDEPRHMNYVTLLLDEHRLPQIINGVEYKGAHSLHPPFYYALLAPIVALFRGLPNNAAWHIARLVSLALCLGALVLLRQIALQAGADRPASAGRFALFVVAGVGLLPIFGMTAGTINNDSAMLFTVTLFLWLLAVKFPRDQSYKAALILGVAMGLGGGSKATALVCDGAALLAYLWVQGGWRGLLQPRTWARFAVTIGVAVLICGWWYGRNELLYGNFTPIALGYSPADMGWLPPASAGRLVQMMHPNFPPLLGRALWGVFYSAWSQKDWIPQTLRAPIYWGLAAFVAVGLAGLWRQSPTIRAREEDGKEENRESEGEKSARASGGVRAEATQREAFLPGRIALWSGAAGLLANWGACLFFALFVHWGWFEGGRYLLASLGGLMLLVGRGWRNWSGARTFALVSIVLVVVLLLFNGLTIFELVFHLNPLAKAAAP